MRALRLRSALWPAARAVSMLALAGCGGTEMSGKIAVGGSDSMVILARRWASAYIDSHPGARVRVRGGGTRAGVLGLAEGSLDICMASRKLREDEAMLIKTERGGFVEIVVAKDAVGIYVNEGNSIERLSLEQVKRIFKGRYSDWRECKGRPGPIGLYGPLLESGTTDYFRERVLRRGEFGAQFKPLPGTAAVVDAVAADPFGIGFGSMAYAQGTKALRLSSRAGGEAVMPGMEAVARGSYPLTRELFFYTAGPQVARVAGFIDWVLSSAGRRVCRVSGYCP